MQSLTNSACVIFCIKLNNLQIDKDDMHYNDYALILINTSYCNLNNDTQLTNRDINMNKFDHHHNAHVHIHTIIHV
jgi:hypothetical protein